MAYVRYQSPDDPAFAVFGASRFRVDHAVFRLRLGPLKGRVAALLEERRDWNLAAMKLVEENRRLVACMDWLEILGNDPDLVAVPDLVHEPALDLVANALIAEGEFARACCPACEADYAADRISREPWAFEEEGIIVRGLRSTCPQGHTIHALTEAIDAPDLEGPED